MALRLIKIKISRWACLEPSPFLSRTLRGYASSGSNTSSKVGGQAAEETVPEVVEKTKVWWRPDPTTGMWVPEDQEDGSVKLTNVPQHRVRTVPTASLDEKAYWNSLEEMPDRHYYP
ncbi:hypothetical protein GOP47_0010362 [Adiantum capillus-veneris]|uniref:Uncharacterized protein n=1 Tax=Adiantum capillus-veneris TaxID=13818 RepID=A0A9D4UV00_ADICA|nr:hypothetical protein GOP47_0010362 [Adiantum capillus-veneris]